MKVYELMFIMYEYKVIITTTYSINKNTNILVPVSSQLRGLRGVYSAIAGAGHPLS